MHRGARPPEDDERDDDAPPALNEADECVGGADDVDAAKVEASLERNVLRPLRKLRSTRVPAGLLTREQAWSLAHASEFLASTDGEMVDPWDYDDSAPATDGGASVSGVPLAEKPVYRQ